MLYVMQRPMSGTFANASKKWTNNRVRKYVPLLHYLAVNDV